jgi:hypothetical protein
MFLKMRINIVQSFNLFSDTTLSMKSRKYSAFEWVQAVTALVTAVAGLIAAIR